MESRKLFLRLFLRLINVEIIYTMNRKVLTAIVGIIITTATFGQSFGDIYEKSIDDAKKIDYPYLREADVIWSKRIWRIIDLREKMNHSLYYPTTKMPDGRRSFMTIVLEKLETKELQGYDPNNMDVPLTYSDIEVKMGAIERIMDIQNMDGSITPTKVKGEAKPEDVKQIMVLEEWYFDKKHSKLEVRIIGLCPIYMGLDPETNKLERKQLFWIKYDEFRDIFARNEAYNRNNDAQRVSYDDLFLQRRFNGYIIAESNVYNNRFITAYLTGKAALFEAERIKEDLFNFEHDLWDF